MVGSRNKPNKRQRDKSLSSDQDESERRNENNDNQGIRANAILNFQHQEEKKSLCVRTQLKLMKHLRILTEPDYSWRFGSVLG